MDIVAGAPNFRPSTRVTVGEANFCLVDAGLGDQVAMLTSLVYLATTQTHLRGNLWCQNFFLPVVKNIFGQIRRNHGWSIFSVEELTEEVLKDKPLMVPSPTSFINGGGAHMLDLGFLYFCGMNHSPSEWSFYQKLNLESIEHSFSLPKKYCCMTPGAMWRTKKMSKFLFNRIADYVKENYGLTPVFLGNSSFKGAHSPTMIDDYDFGRGVNLIDKTDLLTAAKVIDGSEFIIGIDNGLLHLSAMTRASIVDGCTISGPNYVLPKRASGRVFEVTVDEKDLSCIHCQQRMKWVDHHVRECYYKDTRCLDLLDESPWWFSHIDAILGSSGVRKIK